MYLAEPWVYHAQEPNIPCGEIPHFDNMTIKKGRWLRPDGRAVGVMLLSASSGFAYGFEVMVKDIYAGRLDGMDLYTQYGHRS